MTRADRAAQRSTAINDAGATFNVFAPPCLTQSLDVVVTWQRGGPNGTLLAKKIYNYDYYKHYAFGPNTWRSSGNLAGRFGFSQC